MKCPHSRCKFAQLLVQNWPCHARPCLQALARRLEEAVETGLAEEAEFSLIQEASSAAAAALGSPRSPAAGPGVEQQQQQAGEQQQGQQGTAGGEQGLVDSSSQQTQQPPAQQQQQADAASSAWQALLVPLAAVAQVDVRPRAADTAAAVLFSACRAHCGCLSPQQWLRLYQNVLQPLLALPLGDSGYTARMDSAHMLPPASTLLAAAPHGLAPVDGSSGREEGHMRRWTSASGVGGGGGEGGALPAAVPAVLSFEGLDR